MKIIISGQHMEVGQSLQKYITESVSENVKKYFENATTATITLTMERAHYIKTDILINGGMGKKLIIMSTAHDGNAYHSFDEALIKLVRQMRKHKNRMKEHQKNSNQKTEFFEAKYYTISPLYNEEETTSPTIIAEKVTEIETLSVEDAVMKMDLTNLTTLVFTNSGTNRLNILYYRKDGNISWIDIPSK